MERTAKGNPKDRIGTILKHDAKVTSYKIALLRAINDVVLSFPDLVIQKKDIAIPLRFLARFWVAYYWPFVDIETPIYQGPRANRFEKLTNDMAFRSELTAFRKKWEQIWGEKSRPSDGFLAINELQIPRKRRTFSAELISSYNAAITQICQTIKMPIRYAGPGQWQVFDIPKQYGKLGNHVIPIPGTLQKDICLVIESDLFETFQQMSLYIEALCIHEWCLFSENVAQVEKRRVERGFVYELLTDRPDNRRPLTWERNEIDLLLMEGKEFICPWTGIKIDNHTDYDLDHILPVSVYPINELWNLVPSEPDFNSHVKRNRIPDMNRLVKAKPHLCLTYSNYQASKTLDQAIREDVHSRFSTIQESSRNFPNQLTQAVVFFIDRVASFRNLTRF